MGGTDGKRVQGIIIILIEGICTYGPGEFVDGIVISITVIDIGRSVDVERDRAEFFCEFMPELQVGSCHIETIIVRR